MKAVIHIDLSVAKTEEAKNIVEKACKKLQAAGLINDYRYEIETTDGPVTERCVLADGKIIA